MESNDRNKFKKITKYIHCCDNLAKSPNNYFCKTVKNYAIVLLLTAENERPWDGK